MSEELKKKYAKWVIVFSQGARFLGKVEGDLQPGYDVVLNPCYQMYHQVQLVQSQPGGPPGVAFMPIMFGLDLCAHTATPLGTKLETFVRLYDMHDDDLQTYDEMVSNCNKQSEDKINRLRELRTGIKRPTLADVQNLTGRKEN